MALHTVPLAAARPAARPAASTSRCPAPAPASARPARPPATATRAAATPTPPSPDSLAALPTPRGRRFSIPLLGETGPMLADHLGWVHAHVHRDGPAFKANIMGVRGAIVLTSWAAITKVMMGEGKGPDDPNKTSSWWMPPSFRELLGSASDPAVQTDRAAHAKRRRQQATAFTPSAMASYAPRVEAVARASLARWAAAPGPIDLVQELSVTTFGFAETVVDLGLDGEAKQTLLREWSTYVRNLMALPIDFPGTKLHAAKKAKRKILAAIGAAVDRYLAAFDSGAAPPASMLGFYMAARAADGDPLSSEELKDMVLALLLAGHDTSHSGHTVLMATLPKIPLNLQARLAKEQRAVVAKHGDALTAAALNDMPLAEAVSKECLRLLGPADGLWREAAVDFEADGVRIPAGSKLFCSILYAKASDPAIIGPGGLARDAALPPPHMDINALSPEAFNPDRWLGGAAAEPTGGVGTFGMGPRFCLGAPLYMQEAKCLVAVLLREYQVVLEAPVTWAPSWAGQMTRKGGNVIKMGVTRKGEGDIISAANVGKGKAVASAAVPPPAGAVGAASAAAV